LKCRASQIGDTASGEYSLPWGAKILQGDLCARECCIFPPLQETFNVRGSFDSWHKTGPPNPESKQMVGTDDTKTCLMRQVQRHWAEGGDIHPLPKRPPGEGIRLGEKCPLALSFSTWQVFPLPKTLVKNGACRRHFLKMNCPLGMAVGVYAGKSHRG
jgi:hypothetical protein